MKSENSPIRLSSQRISVRFHREGDRFVHVIERNCDSATAGFLGGSANAKSVGGAAHAGFLGSVQCSADEIWPKDAPLQQVVAETLGSPERLAILGVGMSGHGHWSLAVEAFEDDGIRFDWACKISQPATWLGSQYVPMASSTSSPAPWQPAPWLPASHAGTLFHSDRFGNQWVFTAELGSCAWDPDTCHLCIRPEGDPTRIGTHCWRYRVNLA